MFKIMIVDDTLFMRNMLKKKLTGLGHEVVAEAENGEQAVKKAGEHELDLIFMDITMPEKDGIQATKEIKENNKEVKVVMCSVMGQKKFVLDALSEGASDFIVKPFEDCKINEVLEKL